MEEAWKRLQVALIQWTERVVEREKTLSVRREDERYMIEMALDGIKKRRLWIEHS